MIRRATWVEWGAITLVLLLHQFVQYGLGVALPFVDSYLDPLLYMPFLLVIIRWERGRWLGQTRLTGLEVIVITTALALLFEELYPRWDDRFFRDWWDYGCYALGATWYWRRLNGDGNARMQE